MDDSEIIVSKHATVYKGPDATNLFRAICLKQALVAYAQFKMVMSRNLTATSMLVMAKEYTGKVYARGQHNQAATDMDLWINTMKLAMPVTEDRRKNERQD